MYSSSRHTAAGTSDRPPRKRQHRTSNDAASLISLDNLATLLLILPCLVGVVLFGAVRLWSVAPLMLSTFVAVLAYMVRQLTSRQNAAWRVPPGGLAMLPFLAYGLCLIPLSAVTYEARIEALRALSYFGAFWVWTHLASRERRWRPLIAVLIIFGTLVAWYAIVQHMQGTRMVLNLERPENYGMRASGTYMCPNHFAHLMAMLSVVCLALLLMPSAGPALKLLSGYGFALFLPAVFLSQSRSSWVGVATGITVLMFCISLNKGAKRAMAVLIAIPLCLLAVGALLWYTSPMVQERVAGAMLDNPDGAVASRLLMWKDSLEIIKDAPALGHGPGSFRWLYPSYQQHEIQFRIRYAHNEYLHFISEYGFVGLALLGAGLMVLVVRMLRALQTSSRERDVYLIAMALAAMAASFAHATFDFNLHVFANVHVLVALCGIAAGSLFSSGVFAARRLPPSTTGLIGWSGLAASLILAALALQAFLSFGYHRLGEDARKAFEMEKAEHLYKRSMQADPTCWRPYAGLGQAYQAKSFWNIDPDAKAEQAAAALDYLNASLDRNPYDLSVYLALGKAYRTVGREDLALECFERLVELSPKYAFHLALLGVQLKRMDRPEEALRIFRRAARAPGKQVQMIRLNIEALERELAERGPQ